MAISRWGSKAEKAMSEPTPEKSVSDLISEKALQIEQEAISNYIHEWVSKRLRVFEDARIGVWHEGNGHMVRVVYEHQGKLYYGTHICLDTVIITQSVNTKSWSQYLDNVSAALRNQIAEKLTADGVRDLSSRRGTATTNGWYEATGNRTFTSASGMGMVRFTADTTQATKALKNVGEAVKKLSISVQQFDQQMLEAETQEAIESIKRTAAGE